MLSLFILNLHKQIEVPNHLIYNVMSIKGTRTEQNLLKSFAGESQARSRYTFFASVAKKEGYEQISGVFMETAEQEKEHAKKFFKYLEGGMVEITASYPAGIIGTTAENLKTKNGQIYTLNLQRLQTKKVFLRLPIHFVK